MIDKHVKIRDILLDDASFPRRVDRQSRNDTIAQVESLQIPASSQIPIILLKYRSSFSVQE